MRASSAARRKRLLAEMSDDPIDLLKRLVATNSVNPDLVPGGAGEAAIADFCGEWLGGHGFDVHRLEERPGRPSIVIVRSHIAYPAPHAIDTAKAHGSPLGAEEVAATKKVLGWDPDKHFYVPDEVYAHMNGADRGNALETAWEQEFSDWSQAFPKDRETWDAAWAGRIDVRCGRMNSDSYSSTTLYPIRDPTGRARRLITSYVVDSNSMRTISSSLRQ